MVFFQWARGLDVSVITALVTAIAGFTGLLYSQWHSKTRDIAEGHRENKIKVYNIYFDIVQFYLDLAENPSSDNPKTLGEQKEKIKELNRGMIVWSSPKVIKSWTAFRIQATNNPKSKELLFCVDDLLQAIRKDLGNSNFGLKRGDVIRFYLSDPNEL